jgi:hypothetical protein
MAAAVHCRPRPANTATYARPGRRGTRSRSGCTCHSFLIEAVAFQHSPEEEVWREPYRFTARSELGEASWEEGRAMGMEEAVSYALEEGEAGG